jgi:hypothetical protein
MGLKPGLILLSVISVGICGCSAASSTRVEDQSIVSLSPDTNLIANGQFSRTLGATWRVVLPPGGTARRLPAQEALELTVPPATGGTVVLEQTSYFLTNRDTGSSYVLTAQVKLVHARNRLTSELRFNYSGGGYGFVGATRIQSPKQTLSTSVHSAPWINVSVRGTAQLPLTSIAAFVIDAAPADGFAGTVLVRRVSLHTVQ